MSSKELATQSTSRYVQALYNINTGGGPSLDGRDILRMSKDDGYWSFGQDNTEIDETKDVFVINPNSFREGYVAFDEKANDIAETEDGDLADFLWPLGTSPSLEDHEYAHPLLQPARKGAKPLRYKFQLAVDLVCIEGPNKGAQLIYKNGSQGARDMLGKLSGEIARRMENGEEATVPSIALYAESYQHKTYGRIWKPKAEILDWFTLDDDVVRDPAPKEEAREERDDRKSSARTDRKTAKADRRGTRDQDEDEADTRSRSRRGRDDREVEDSRLDDKLEDLERTSGRRTARSVEEEEERTERRGRDRDEQPARGEGRRERRSRDRDEEPEERRPARGERRSRR